MDSNGASEGGYEDGVVIEGQGAIEPREHNGENVLGLQYL